MPAPCNTHHPHFGEVQQAVLGERGGAFFDEREVGEVEPQVRDAGRVAAVQGVPQSPETTIRRNYVLQLLDRLLRLEKGAKLR